MNLDTTAHSWDLKIKSLLSARFFVRLLLTYKTVPEINFRFLIVLKIEEVILALFIIFIVIKN